MLKPSQIIAIFGVFCSMFYIFKYGGTNPAYAKSLCQDLMRLQIESVVDLTPLIQQDSTDKSFDEKLQNALIDMQKDMKFTGRHDRIVQLQKQLDGQACPAPSLVQMTRIAAGSI